jgi:tetratricopeptide (TPR) repeat protein
VTTLKTQSSNPSELVDLAESLRQGGQLLEALETIERCLQKSPRHARGLLLYCRILYLSGRYAEALHVLSSLEEIVGRDEGFTKITKGLEELWQKPDPKLDPAFVTETMAELHISQGYLWEAMEIYRQIFLASEGQEQLWQKILDLRDRLDQEESGKAEGERASERLESLNRWIKNQQGGLIDG